MIKRIAEMEVLDLARTFPCVAIVGPRQVGKTTLAKRLSKKLRRPVLYLDLERPKAVEMLKDAEAYLTAQEGKTVILDEIQRIPELFPLLRSLVDEHRYAGRFIILGSASPDLIRQSSESLAGRIAYVELAPLTLPEIGKRLNLRDAWFRGGFPEIVEGKQPFDRWMDNFVRTYLEKDLPALGFPANRQKAERLWSMLAHSHGGLLNASVLAKSLDLTDKTVKSYIDFFEGAFLVRQLRPFHFSLKKRMVKAPKVYLRDSGVLHHLLGIEGPDDLFGIPQAGASWEGFVIEQIAALKTLQQKLYFYRTHDGAELDLVIARGSRAKASIEIKMGTGVHTSKGNLLAAQSLKTRSNFVIIQEGEEWTMSNGFVVCPLVKFLSKHLPTI